ncbi:MAG TPA: SDR family NAD(P)-dependent oxidoreductase, partial [Bryobacteraceae bacterium]|nr:SDR family NAD(P)-dependent oxidoreductase [Bryobacteraceae bacterium]
MHEKKLAGKTALITGASKGLGKAMALSLAEAGAQIALVSRDQAKLEGVAGEIRERGGKADVFRADVSREADVSALEKEVSSLFGKIQILINNAGVNVRKPITDFTLDEWNYVLGTNLTAAFLLCRAFVPH